jgi:hypothetical protein
MHHDILNLLCQYDIYFWIYIVVLNIHEILEIQQITIKQSIILTLMMIWNQQLLMANIKLSLL